jgi:hypothetical protein
MVVEYIVCYTTGCVVIYIRLTGIEFIAAFFLLDMSVNPFGPSFTQNMSVNGQHPTAGLGLVYDTDQDRFIVADMCQGTPVHRIVSWRSRMQNAHLLAINGKDVHLVADFATRISELQSTDPGCIVDLQLSFDDAIHGLIAAGLPQLYFDQLSVIQAHIQAACTHTVHATSQSKRLTRHMLLQQEDWPEWEKAKFKQLDAHHSQGMFGMPQTPTPADIIFYWVWVYAIKQHENNRKKACAVCDGSTRSNQAVVHGHTFVPMPDMANLRLQLALAASLGLLMFTADVTNAFAEADHPKQQYCMRVDDAFRNWWNKRFPQLPLPCDAVIPIDKNLQGHPEGPRQWSIHIDRILRVHFGLTLTTHAPCLYCGVLQGPCILFL